MWRDFHCFACFCRLKKKRNHARSLINETRVKNKQSLVRKVIEELIGAEICHSRSQGLRTNNKLNRGHMAYFPYILKQK